jgi:hypothetical protein
MALLDASYDKYSGTVYKSRNLTSIQYDIVRNPNAPCMGAADYWAKVQPKAHNTRWGVGNKDRRGN